MEPSPSFRPNRLLREHRLERHWTQRELADKLGTTEVTVKRWERGSQQPSAYYRLRLCSLFAKSSAELGLLQEEPVEPVVSASETASPPATPLLDNASFSSSFQQSSLSLQLMQLPRALTQEQQNRLLLLHRLQRAYRDLLEHSVPSTNWIELNLKDFPEAVQNVTQRLRPRMNYAEHSWPSGTTLLHVYEAVSGELLILGESGCGKSTLLLDLALQLVERAEQTETQPFPVIFPLSSWAQSRLPLHLWLAEQLSQIYDLPITLANQLVEAHQILPLLDGLDEMEVSARPACITAINTYHHHHLMPLVVCSRRTEYEEATRQQQLRLQGALIVQPLSAEQVETYLCQQGEQATALRESLYQHAELQSVVTTPLLLSILARTYQDNPTQDLPQNGPPVMQQREILAHYVTHMLSQRSSGKLQSLTYLSQWLRPLAQHMRQQNQTIFYLEHLQPDWLSSRQRRIYLWGGLRLPALLMGILALLLIQGFLVVLSPPLANVLGWELLINVLLGSFLGWLWSESAVARILPAEGQSKGYQRWIKRVVISLLLGVLVGVVFGKVSFEQQINASLLVGSIIGLGSLFLQVRFAHTSKRKSIHVPPSESSGRLRQDWRKGSWERAVLVALLFGSVFGLLYGLEERANYWWSYGLSYALIVGVSYGLRSRLVGLTIGLFAGDIRLTERVRWSWRSMVRSLCTVTHLSRSLALIVGLALIIGVSYGLSSGVSIGLSYGLSVGLSYGLSYWCLFGLFQGIVPEQMDDEYRLIPNEGIRRSWRNSLILGIGSGGMIGAINLLEFLLSAWFGQGSSIMHPYNPVYQLLIVLVMAVSAGGFVWLLTGGVAVLRHLIIRRLLWHSRVLPWRAVSFLTDAADCTLLSRVGGGYSFVHRLILDYFADEEVK